MKKKLFIVVILFVLAIFCVSNNNEEKFVANWNIELTATDVTNLGMKLKVQPHRTNENVQIQSDQCFDIEIFDGNEWVKKAENIHFSNDVIFGKEEDIYTQGYKYLLNWTDEVGQLEKGKYRISLDFTIIEVEEGISSTRETKYKSPFYAEFIL